MATRLHMDVAIAACDAIAALIDVGAGVSTVVVYDGVKPTKVEDAVTPQNVLTTFDLPDPVFGPAADDGAGGARATADVIDPVNASGTGLATWFRVYDGDGKGVLQGDAGTAQSAAEMRLNDPNLVSGIQVQIFSWTLTVPTV